MDKAYLEDEPLIIFKAVSCFQYFYFNYQVLQSYGKKFAPFFINEATILQMFKEVIHYPLLVALESNQLPQKCVLLAEVTNSLRNLSEGCQYPLAPY